ncbi:MAG: ABC transporter permease [Acidilobaceae archaeon]|nr:ABC transporter permease [Acidilobaceae archaeon]MCX8165590.1 ABC transporter permease [Acidilobaceae archaeon]MDW7974017.1 ABC transporter permease [Sulfolobales archaeon]
MRPAELPFLLFLLAFFYAPFALLLYYSFTDRGGSFTLENYVEIFLNPSYLNTIAYSLLISLLVVIATLSITLPISLYVAIFASNLERAVLLVAFITPFWIDFLIRAWAMKNVLYSLGIREGFLAMILGLVYDLLPYMFLPTYLALSRVPLSMISAARVLGADWFTIITQVLLPYALPGIFVGSVLVGLLAFAEFIIPSLLGGTSGLTVGALVYTLILKGDQWGVGAAISLLVTGITLLIVLSLSWRFRGASS